MTTRRLERALGALELLLAALFLLVAAAFIGSSVLSALRPPAAPPRQGNGNWAWGLGIFLLPPAVVLGVAGLALRRGWRARWWLQLLLALAWGVTALAL